MKPHMSGPSIVDSGNTAGRNAVDVLPLHEAEVAASA